MCDDLTATMADLAGKGAEFVGDIREVGWGVAARLKVPGTRVELTLYQPRYDPPATAE
jgi:hypothetical protein